MVFGRAHIVGIVLLTTLAWGCKSPEREAVITFSETRSCPEDRIQATPAGGASFAERYAALHPLPVPPADIAADAGRLEIWRKANGGNREWTQEYIVYRVNGCGQSEELACMCPGVFSGATCTGCRTAQDMCTCRDLEVEPGNFAESSASR